MRNERTFYLNLMVLWICFVFTNSSISAFAQSSDNEKFGQKNFGSSLKKLGKKKRDKAENKNQNSKTAEDDAIISVETNLIVNDVLVFDKKEKIVKGLQKEDFIIKEDGELQEIEVFSLGGGETIPRSIVLIIDYSSSQLPYIKASVEAAKILVDKLDPQDRMAIVTDNVELLQDFTQDKILLKEKLDSLKNSALSGEMGKSRQYSALMAALNELFDKEVLRPIIIFQTDGDELVQLKGETANSSFASLEKINFSYKDILTVTEKTRATIYTVIPGMRFVGIPKNEKLKRAKTYLINQEKSFAEARNFVFKPGEITDNSLKSRAELLYRQQAAIAEIAKFTGGWTDYLEQPDQAEKVYSEILSGINRRYVIGYYPTNQVRGGKIRKVKTEVRGHPEYNILGRKTYILDEEKNK